MKIELIQPFINAADAVLGQVLQAPAEIREVTMEEDTYRRKGVAASVAIRGDLQGRVIFDVESEAAQQIARVLAGSDAAYTEQIARETVCELANMVVGNAVTLLNNLGSRFKIFPPEVHTTDTASAAGQKSESLALCFETCCGNVHMNIALDYSHAEPVAAGNVS